MKMVDVTFLAAAAVNALVPYLTKGGETIAEEAGKNLFAWIKDKFHLAKKEKALSILEEKPEDARTQGRIEEILETILSNNNILVQELSQLIEKTKKENIHIVENSKNVINASVKAGGNVIVGDNNQSSK